MKKGAFKVDFICFPSLDIQNVLKLGSQWCSPVSGLGWCSGWYMGLVTPSLRQNLYLGFLVAEKQGCLYLVWEAIGVLVV